ncbi:MAG: hypothetical protein GY788_31340 [bacterium]|nr:hypothetical protein [bacterium]
MNRVFLCAGLLLVSFVLGEVAARYGIGLGTPPLSIVHPKIEYMFSPNQLLYRFHKFHLYNEYGMRSVNMSVVKQPKRVLVFGDSVLNGGSLTDHADLATTLATGSDTFFGNVSAGSWGPANMRAWIDEFGFLGADTVILLLSSHDLEDIPSFLPLDPRTHPTRRPISALVEGVQRYLSKYLCAVLSENPTSDPSNASVKTTTTRTDAGVAEINALVDRVAVADKRLCLILHQTQKELRTAPAASLGVIEKLFAARGIPVLDFATALSEAQTSRIKVYRDDIHINPVGQQLLSNYLIRCANIASLPSTPG